MESSKVVCKQIKNVIYFHAPYLYGNKPHAVRNAGSIAFQYDLNGNMTQRYDGGTSVTLDLAWNHDNKPSVISRRVGGGASQPYLTFTYDGRSQRVRKYNHFTGATTLYFGEVYEIRNEEPIIHLFANTQRIASIHEDGRMQYYHGNHLHSASVVTDGYGNTKETIEYHPYGTYRLRTDLDASFPNVNYTFTDQEEDDEAGLYNYKARLYDPLLGRFISADSIVPEPGNLQAYNRYSYCLNNPVVYTDPSGHWFGIDDLVSAVIGGIIGGISAAVTGGNILQGTATGAAAGWVAWNTMGAATGSLLTQVVENAYTGEVYSAIGFATANMAGCAAGGAAGGTVAGGMGAGLNGGDIGYGMLRGMGLGALGGTAFGGIDYYYGGNWTLGRVGAYGAAGGGMGELSGEGFGQGALFAGGAAFARYGYNKMVGYDVTWQAGKGYQPKDRFAMPQPGFCHIGEQGVGNDPGGWLNEGGKISRFTNNIPGVNAVAGMHDVMQIKLDQFFGSQALGSFMRSTLNWANMVPAALFTTAGQLANPAAMTFFVIDPTGKR
ncbi:MAG TPA: RHS repeat-associated core domain-containing protein [Syntrophorhabdaceae bacterium]|nr:RHS repeat-associated core domain-containing protein [Syntrophorhabdaceae bacterium]